MNQANLSETQRILIGIPGLSTLTVDELEALREYLRSEAYPAGGVIFAEGDPGQDLYVIKSGIVEIVKKGTDEFCGTVRLARRGPGEIVGEAAVIEDQPYFATAVCVEPTRVAIMSRRDFLRLLQTRPELAQRILRVMIARIKEADLARVKELEEKNRMLQESSAQLHRALKDLESANRQLYEALQFRQRLLDVSPFPVIVTNGDLVVTYCSPAVERVFGVEAKTGAGWEIGELLGWRGPDEGAAIARALHEQGHWEEEAELSTRDGRRVVCRIAAAPVPLENEPASIFLFVFHDETEIRLLQRQAVERERLASKGEMAAEIAHEMNNYLAVISGNIELLPMFLESGNTERVDKCLKTLEASLGRMQVFSNALLSSRPPAREKVLENINRFLENQVAFLKPQRKFKKVIIRLSCDEQIPSVEFDPLGLQQVIHNLVLNCAEALVAAGNPEPVVSIATRWTPQPGAAVVEITDNGPGFEPGMLGKLFHERVTTKPGNHGVGLITVHKIIDQLGGTIVAGNRAGGGAIFTIQIPAPSREPEFSTTKVALDRHS